MSRVLLVNMPFSNLRWPNLGPSLLKAALPRRKIPCEIAYFNFDFAERVGLEHYNWIADYFAFVLGGERLFAKHYFAGQLSSDDAYCRDVLLDADPGFGDQDRRDFERTERFVEPFLDRCIEAVDWSRYAVVGFAASFQQTMPSMCLARRIKQLHPETTVVFGGAACEGEMGVEMLRCFPELDYVFLGEADRTFPAVVEQILGGGPVELPPGVAGRGAAAVADPVGCMVRDMDSLPYPDFDDYFARLKESPLAGQIDSTLFFETSRGCWWGQKHHCTFCGLNGGTLAYRRKSPDRAVDELRYLVDRHDVHRACSADNILDHRYFKTFLPRLKEADLDLAFVYEMKTNLTRPQVRSLLDAGLGAAQLGIETFITPVLRMIGKGANALQNLQALKWFSEARIEVKWNLLYGFPGENPDDYPPLAELLETLVHLAPPLAVGRVRLDRFSPYFDDPAAHGMANPRPHRAFSHVYPFAPESLERVAYYYQYDYADGRDPGEYAGDVLKTIDHWQQSAGTATLNCFDRDDGVLLITDTRPCAAEFQYRLTRWEREMYRFCDTGRSRETIVQWAAGRWGSDAPGETAIGAVLDQWIDRAIAVCLDGRYLSLALRSPAAGGPLIASRV
ncbi:MAG: RiPP maturation radical SAM protein 1 [Planctomycetes bacterium]|nr:RiPP maturation radical SAM protein 1 [Planctomycetota bacterium]